MTDLFSIAGKRPLVTGGSRGIGLMIARGFVAAGAQVTISSRKADVCEQVAAELTAAGPGTCDAIPADLSTEAECARLAGEVAGRTDVLHVLVNNAGATLGRSAGGHDTASWARGLDVNVQAVFHLTKSCRSLLDGAATDDDPARVINVGSIDGIRAPTLGDVRGDGGNARGFGDDIAAGAAPASGAPTTWPYENVSEADAALARQGRYHRVAGNLEVKEVVIDDGEMRDRFVICRNPDQADRDRVVRDQLLAQLTDAITASDKLSTTARATLAGGLPAGLRRFLRTTPGGLLRIDRAAVTAEERLDGKFLLRTSDPTLSAEDIALGYKQLLEVERGWRDMKSTLELRPVYHRLEHRIRAHVVLCWLALLLIRIAETGTADTWRNLRHELDRMHLGTFTGSAGTVRRRTATTTGQTAILRALDLAEPGEFSDLRPARTPAA